jgi:hypothetical protein
MIGVLLESMWGWGAYNDPGEEAPRYFRINPDNFSGRRLHRMCNGVSFLVTNSCRTVQESANHHGIPDPKWVADNLKFLESEGMKLLLVGGKIAKTTYEKALTFPYSGLYIPGYTVIYMDHPAARRWSNATLDAMTEKIAKALK